ncbi:MAPEG family protein [Thermaurantiacus sp.]
MKVTIATACFTTLLLMALSLWVVDGRRRWQVSVGDGGRPELFARIRAQANLAEYGPLTLILLFLSEQALGSGWFVTSMAALFLFGRIAHPIGMVRPAPNPFRALGMVGTWLAMVSLALALLVHLLWS